MGKLPYRWHPEGTRHVSLDEIQPGLLWPYQHEVFRVVEVRKPAEVDLSDRERRSIENLRPDFLDRNWPRRVTMRPVGVNTGDVRDRDHDQSYGFLRHHWEYLRFYPDEHYPVCATCGEPVPCRDKVAGRIGEDAVSRMARYEIAGVCPACAEPVTERQLSRTWEENTEVPLGPPVTFHLRLKCRQSAMYYERGWQAADATNRRCTLSCTGHLINHNDGTYQCSELTECPGPTARHRGYECCRCPDCHARGPFGCFPPASARNLAFDSALPVVPSTGETT